MVVFFGVFCFYLFDEKPRCECQSRPMLARETVTDISYNAKSIFYILIIQEDLPLSEMFEKKILHPHYRCLIFNLDMNALYRGTPSHHVMYTAC